MVKESIANSQCGFNNEILIINLANVQFYALNYPYYISNVNPLKYPIQMEFYSSVAFQVLC
jgi:hypothetical protein